MEQNPASPFIFFLVLEEKLPRSYYAFDAHLKELGYILVPVRIDQLQTLVAATKQEQVIVVASVTDSRELKLYNDKVRGLLKFVLKSKRLTFMHLSSFSKVNDTRLFAMLKNYFFMKYPLDARELSAKIVRYHELKSETNVRWPGGKRAGLGAVA